MAAPTTPTLAFPPGSVIRRVNEEPAVFFGAGRALLLQVAHPGVGQGVADHSEFQRNPFKRLLGTLEATYTMVFGPDDLAAGVARRVHWIHEHVVGPTYEANDPDLLLWVHATLVDSALGCYERLMGPLPADVAETYYDQMCSIAVRFGCPRERQPANLAEFRAWFEAKVHEIEVTDTGRRLAVDIVRPRLPLRSDIPLGPPLALQRLVAIGTTPAPLRSQLGFDWDERRQRRLDRALDTSGRILRATPHALRVAPVHALGRVLLRQARRHVAAFEARQPAPA